MGCRDVGQDRTDRDALRAAMARPAPGRHRGGAVSFISLSAESAGRRSRLTFAYARDQMIFGSKYLSRMSPGTHVPATALIVWARYRVDRALCVGLQDAITIIISFAAVGNYISFQMIVLAALDSAHQGLAAVGSIHVGCWGVVA